MYVLGNGIGNEGGKVWVRARRPVYCFFVCGLEEVEFVSLISLKDRSDFVIIDWTLGLYFMSGENIGVTYTCFSLGLLFYLIDVKLFFFFSCMTEMTDVDTLLYFTSKRCRQGLTMSLRQRAKRDASKVDAAGRIRVNGTSKWRAFCSAPNA